MKLGIRLLSYVLILSLLITGMFFPVYGQNEDGYKREDLFSDIKGHWGQDVIEKFVDKGWVIGYDDGLFRPNRLVTR